MDYTEKIKNNLNNCLSKTELNTGQKKEGKVRDQYALDDKVILITTDRQSAFDRILASIPYKGQVLNQTSAWWFKKTRHIIDNHLLEMPDPNVIIAKKCKVFPVEFVVRGYMTGSTDTAVWTNYQNGVRNFCGNVLPEGMKKNQPFNVPIITPTTKSDLHDQNVSPQEIVDSGLMTKADWEYISQKALELFRFGQATAKQNGLILVDTKYEFGKDASGKILLIDEIHTPDSSRYWIADTYKDRYDNGQEPENIDKEFLRLWFKEHCDPYKDSVLPEAPDELIIELSNRYIQLFEMITGEKFAFEENQQDIYNRLKNNLENYSTNTQPTQTKSESKMIIIDEDEQNINNKEIEVVIIMGSESDTEHAQIIIDQLNEKDIKNCLHTASAHKQAAKLLQILEDYKNKRVIFITIAGMSNALSGFVAGNTDKPVIACPPFKDKLDMMININSTLQMPSKVPVMTILNPKNTALAVERLVQTLT